MNTIEYVAEPTAVDFHASEAVVRGYLGPVGNGKSVACIKEIVRLAQDQYPNEDGIRKTRWAITRNTTLELRSTTLNTWKQWLPEEMCPITNHPMIIAKCKQPLNDGTHMQFEVYFLALDRDEDVKKLLSLELTGMFINEAREMSYAVVKGGRERIGRYPSVIDGYQDNPEKDYKAPRWTQEDLDNDPTLQKEQLGRYKPCKRKSLIMDTNPPDDDHWWYQLAEEGCLRSTPAHTKDFAISETERIFEFFRGTAPLIKQPNGTYEPNPHAENIDHLPGGYQYYMDMIAGNDEDHINVMVLGNYGHMKTGKPVYPEYNDRLHCPETGIIPIKGIPIAMGWDFGLTPSCVIGQLTDLGQVLIHDELFSEDMGVRQFARDVVKPILATKYKGFEVLFSLGDPSGSARGESEAKSAIGILNDEYVHNDDGDIIVPLDMGFVTEGAPTNDPTARLDSVKGFLTRLVDGGYPAYVLNKSCKYLRKGKMGGYKYKKIQLSGESRYNLKPDKNIFSHPADAEQYLTCGYTLGTYQERDVDDDYFDEYEEKGSGGY
jgi:hypothetical protein